MLEKIKSPKDLKSLSFDELNVLCQEIRQKLISTVKANGGHLASNLGVVELTVAMHYVFDEKDKIVWDVGHQSYVHKILTGRAENFDTLRKQNGICGFPDVQESSYDSFNVGHASTSISAALGMACARDLNDENHMVTAVIGDGSLTGGESYEALNNVQNTRLLIIFNDNKMSIDENVGSATRNLSKIRVGKYDKNKKKLKEFLSKIPYFGNHLNNFIRKVIRAHKLRVLKNLYFDNFNLKYIGPVDGHDVKELIFYLESIKNNVQKPTVLHVRTIKGKGMSEAEQHPDKYHKVILPDNEISSSKVVSNKICELAKHNETMVGITAAMKGSVGLADFEKNFPNRFFDVGIAEEHAVTFAGGLASAHKKPYFAVYSTFLQRAYDQILHDVATQNLPVTFLVDKCGFIGDDGQSHQGLYDISLLSTIPNLTILSASTKLQLEQMLEFSTNFNLPLAIRYNKSILDLPIEFDSSAWNIVQKGTKIKLLVVGSVLLKNVLDAFENNKNVEIVCVTSIKPLDKTYLNSLSSDNVVITLEDNAKNGGFGSLIKNEVTICPVHTIAVQDKFIRHATVSQQLEDCGMSTNALKQFVEKLI